MDTRKTICFSVINKLKTELLNVFHRKRHRDYWKMVIGLCENSH